MYLDLFYESLSNDEVLFKYYLEGKLEKLIYGDPSWELTLNPDHSTGNICLFTKGFGIIQSCFLRLESLDIEADWKIIKENENSKEAYQKIINYEITRLYESIENNKYIYLQKLKAIRALDPSKNWKEFYDLVRTLCNSMLKSFSEFKAIPMKSIEKKTETFKPYASMTFISLALK